MCGYPVVPASNKCSLNICLTFRRSCAEGGEKHEPTANRRLCGWLCLSFLSSAIQLCPNLHLSCKTKSVQFTRPAAPGAKVITGSYCTNIASTLWSAKGWLSISYWVLVTLSFLLWLWFFHFLVCFGTSAAELTHSWNWPQPNDFLSKGKHDLNTWWKSVPSKENIHAKKASMAAVEGEGRT